MKTFKKILALSCTVVSLFSAFGQSHANSLVASSNNGPVRFYDVLSTVVLEEDKQEALRQCTEAGGQGCEIILEVPSNSSAVLARGMKGVSVFSHPNPEVAMNQAVANCNKKYKPCYPALAVWVPYVPYAAYAEFNGDPKSHHSFFAYNYGDKDSAEKSALEECKKRASHDCTIVGSWSGKVAFAYAGTEDSHGYAWKSDMNTAKKDAIANCKVHASKPSSCKITYTADNPGPTSEPKNFQSVQKKVTALKETATRGNAPVASRTVERNTVTCHNQCMNGDCIRTFPDGHKERWQAPRVLDPFTNDWKWDTNSCGG